MNAEDGQIPIELIKTGDKVWAFDESTGAIDRKEVLQTTERECDHTIELYTTQETIETTAEHPFYTTEGWKDAADLQAGDKIVTKNNETVEITATRFSYEPKRVYNFEVADWHTYFVGALAWLVYNVAKCVTEIVKRLPKNKGEWLGDVGESLWKSTKSAVNKVTKGEGVPFKNGYPDFSK